MKNCGGLTAAPRENLACGVIEHGGCPFTGAYDVYFCSVGRGLDPDVDALRWAPALPMYLLFPVGL